TRSVDVHDRVHDHPAGVHHWLPPPQSLRPGLLPRIARQQVRAVGLGNGWLALAAGLSEMLCIRSEARLQRVRPADQLKPGRDLPVVQIRMITALTADE